MRTFHKVVLGAVFAAYSVALVMHGRQVQLQQDMRDGLSSGVPWDSTYTNDTWVEVVEAMSRANSFDLRLAVIVAQEGYRLGMANGAAQAFGKQLEAHRDGR